MSVPDFTVIYLVAVSTRICEYMSVCFHTWLTFRTVGASSSLSLFIAATGVSLKYGGSPSTISTTIIPIDQISTWCIIIQLNYAADLICCHCWHLRYMRMVPTVFFSMAAFECAPPHLSAIW